MTLTAATKLARMLRAAGAKVRVRRHRPRRGRNFYSVVQL